MSTGVLCPVDGGKIVERRSRFGKSFYSCANYPECKFAIWNKPVLRPCPQCGAPFLVEKYSKKTGLSVVCMKKECGYKEELKADAVEQGAESKVQEPTSSVK
jgi:DNA topoisomerase-1